MSPAVLASLAVVALWCAAGTEAAGDTVSARQPLRGNETVVSSLGKFELGIFSVVDGSGRFYLGIWYKNVPGQTAIWIGNRARPLSDARSAVLRVSSDDGNLELIGITEHSTTPGVVWSSNMSSLSRSSSSSPAGSNVAVMRDNGNLVLLDGGNSSNVLWQSFDQPTDTLVPEAWLGENKLTGEYQTLTSWRSAEDPAPGMFSCAVDPNGSSEFFYLWNRSRAYWRSGVWTGRVFANLPEAVNNVLFNQTYVETPAYRRITSVLYDNATITRLVLDVTGQTKQYIWVPYSQSWNFFWAAPTVQCDVYALCGAFGICSQRSEPPCQCPLGFTPAAEHEWGLSDWSGGCCRRGDAPLHCGANGSTDGFMELPYMKPPDGSVTVSARSRAECESACLNNCSCQAYTFSGSGGGCSIWNGGFRNLQQLYKDAGGSSVSLYLRLSESELRRQQGGKKKIGSSGLVAGVVVGCLAVLGALAVAAWILLSRRRKLLAQQANQKAGSYLHVYSLSELRAATKNFSERLGGGGFGSVYRGIVDGDTEVAVKKLEGLRQGDKQFRTEVTTLGLIQHVNLVRLLGFCSSGHENKLLVYEYMPNGSLDSFLFSGGDNSAGAPSWRDRYGVMLGVARGLAYLHEGCRECIIHCDIKPENILLDKDMTPKIADFGMAKLVGRDFSRVLTTMRGTIGYLAPEWISGLPIGVKADVYSFGMVLFELISGRRNTEAYSRGDQQAAADDDEAGGQRRPSTTFFPVWAAARLAEGNTAAVADARLRGDVREEELERACRVACWCIQDQEAHRPTMAQVVQALEGSVVVHLPPVPRVLQHLTTLA